VTLYCYGQSMPDHVYFLLFWLTIFNFLFCYVFYLFYEADEKTFISQLKYCFISQKRSFITPFFVIGILSALNYVLVAVANPHVQAIYQVIASILQLPFVMFFNWLINGETLWSPHLSVPRQLLFLGVILFSYIAGLSLISLSEFKSNFSNIGWFLCYLLSTLPLPLISVIFQSLFSPKEKYNQEDFETYSSPSLAIMMLNFWQGIWLTVTIFLIPIADGTGISYSFSTGFSCVISQTTVDPNDNCQNVFLILTLLTFCVIFNFYASIKVISFEDANVAILVQQLGPILAAFVFSTKQLMGTFYDGQVNTWESYTSIACILVAFLFYKIHKSAIKKEEKKNK